MSQQAKRYYTSEEYLAAEKSADFKSEYYNGQIFAMADGSGRHSVVAGNLLTELNLKLRKRPYTVFNSDIKVLIKANGLYTYPDVTVVCDEVQYAANKDGSIRDDILTNPVLLAEVLSPSTESYDRRGKFSLYRALPSLQHYLLVDPTRPWVDYYQKTGQGWLLRSYESLEDSLKLRLGGSSLSLALALIYDKITFD